MVGGVGVAQELEDKGAVRRTDARLSMGFDAFVGGDAVGLQQPAHLGGRFQ
jgi:hypothetical protein